MEVLLAFPAAVVLVGFLVVFFNIRSDHKVDRKIRNLGQPPEPICGCGHHYSFHSKKNQDCRANVTVGWMDRFFGDTETCQCQQYIGPTPLPEYYAPEQ